LGGVVVPILHQILTFARSAPRIPTVGGCQITLRALAMYAGKLRSDSVNLSGSTPGELTFSAMTYSRPTLPLLMSTSPAQMIRLLLSLSTFDPQPSATAMTAP